MRKLIKDFREKNSTLNTLVSYKDYTATMSKLFRDPPIRDELLHLIFDRFKPLKFTDDG